MFMLNRSLLETIDSHNSKVSSNLFTQGSSKTVECGHRTLGRTEPTSARTWSNVEIGAKNIMAFTGKSDELLQGGDWMRCTVIKIRGPLHVADSWNPQCRISGLGFRNDRRDGSHATHLPGHASKLSILESESVFEDAVGFQPRS